MDEFYIRRASNDGLQRTCKGCSRAYSKDWIGVNISRKAETDRIYRAVNKPARRATDRAWQQANPDKVALKKHRYRARKTSATIELVPDDILEQLVSLYGPYCMDPTCDQPITDDNKLTLDHVVPLSIGGSHSVDNLQILCRSCNCRKGNRNSIDYRSYIRVETK